MLIKRQSLTKRQINLLIEYIRLRSELSAASFIETPRPNETQRVKEAEYAFRESFEEDVQPRRNLTAQERLDAIADIFDHARSNNREITSVERSLIWQYAAGTYRNDYAK